MREALLTKPRKPWRDAQVVYFYIRGDNLWYAVGVMHDTDVPVVCYQRGGVN